MEFQGTTTDAINAQERLPHSSSGLVNLIKDHFSSSSTIFEHDISPSIFIETRNTAGPELIQPTQRVGKIPQPAVTLSMQGFCASIEIPQVRCSIISKSISDFACQTGIIANQILVNCQAIESSSYPTHGSILLDKSPKHHVSETNVPLSWTEDLDEKKLINTYQTLIQDPSFTSVAQQLQDLMLGKNSVQLNNSR